MSKLLSLSYIRLESSSFSKIYIREINFVTLA